MNNYKTYTKREEALVRLNHKIKDFIFKPFLYLFTLLNIPPNFIAALSSITIIGGLLGAYHFSDPNLYIITLWIHFLLNAIDGPLARYQDNHDNRGAITDSLTDFLGVLTTLIFISLNTTVASWSLIVLITFYLIEVYNILISSLLQAQLDFGFKPRFLIYAITTTDILLQTSWLPMTILVLSGVMLPIVLLSFVNIYRITK